jgi:hypothetical protein
LTTDKYLKGEVMEHQTLLAEFEKLSLSEIIDLYLESHKGHDTFSQGIPVHIVELVDKLESEIDSWQKQPF